MLLRDEYDVTLDASSVRFMLPLTIEADAGVKCRLSDHGGGYRLVIDRSVDAAALTPGRHRDTLRGEPGAPYVDLGQDVPDISTVVRDVTCALAFLTDKRRSPVTRRRRLIPEHSTEEHLLAEFGTDEPYIGTEVAATHRTFLGRVDSDLLNRLAERSVGLCIYEHALLSDNATARFRDLWKVLESAFGTEGRELVKTLAQYAPAVEMGFDNKELEDLRRWRGRASHAQSRAGHVELARVEANCLERLRRLKHLAERVILTKGTWGRPTRDVDELLPLWGYTDRDGNLRYIGKDNRGDPRKRL